MTYLANKASKLSPSAYVVLGMIHLGRRSGYEIKQAVELSIRFFWTISHAQIYPALENLEKAGLIRGRNDPRGRLPRRVFTVTRAGKAALKGWLKRDEPLPYELRDIGLVKLFFADLQDRAAARQLVETIRRRSAERIAQLEAIGPVADSLADDEGYSFPRVTLRIGIAHHRALLEECETIVRELSGKSRLGGPRFNGPRTPRPAGPSLSRRRP
jgi:PadR family transcriptional regulator AphA